MKSSDSWNVVIAAASLFAYVIAIMTLSKREVMGGGRQANLAAFFIVLAVIASVGVLGGFVLQFQPAFMINLFLFAAVMIFTFRRYLATESSAELMQKAIRNMVVSIIILDSVFVSGTAGIIYGMATLLFIIPTIVLARKMYVT